MEEKTDDDPSTPTPIPLGLRESWRGLHGCAEIADELWWCQGKQILVRRTDDLGKWRRLTDAHLKCLHQWGYIADDVRDRMSIRLLT